MSKPVEWPLVCIESWAETLRRWADDGKHNLTPGALKALAHTMEAARDHYRKQAEGPPPPPPKPEE